MQSIFLALITATMCCTFNMCFSATNILAISQVLFLNRVRFLKVSKRKPKCYFLSFIIQFTLPVGFITQKSKFHSSMQCNLLFRSVRGSTQGKEMHLMAVKNRENVFWFGDVFIF